MAKNTPKGIELEHAALTQTYPIARICLRRLGYPYHLYKYRFLDHSDEESVSRARALLVHDQLWLSSPLSFNDPFDTAAKLEVGGTAAERRAAMERYLIEKRVSFKERKKRLTEFWSAGPAIIEERMRAAYHNGLKIMGVCSFAGDPRSILMWSHYAQQHQGYCVGYDVVRDPRVLIQAVKVRYSKQYPTIEWRGSFGESDDFTEALLRKYDAWSYEAERRILTQDGAGTAFQVAPSAMQVLILGARVSAANEALIRTLLSEREALSKPAPRILRADLHTSSYALCLRSGAA